MAIRGETEAHGPSAQRRILGRPEEANARNTVQVGEVQHATVHTQKRICGSHCRERLGERETRAWAPGETSVATRDVGDDPVRMAFQYANKRGPETRRGPSLVGESLVVNHKHAFAASMAMPRAECPECGTPRPRRSDARPGKERRDQSDGAVSGVFADAVVDHATATRREANAVAVDGRVQHVVELRALPRNQGQQKRCIAQGFERRTHIKLVAAVHSATPGDRGEPHAWQFASQQPHSDVLPHVVSLTTETLLERP